MSVKKNLILDHVQVRQKIRRMAYQIFENNFSEKSVVLAGIEGQGYRLAQMLGEELAGISPIKTVVAKLSLDKASPEKSEVKMDVTSDVLRRKSVIVIDDVLNTGRTL